MFSKFNWLIEPNSYNDRNSIVFYFLWMKFSIAAEFEIIEEAWIAINQPASCFLVIEISVNHQFAAGLFQISDVIRLSIFLKLPI